MAVILTGWNWSEVGQFTSLWSQQGPLALHVHSDASLASVFTNQFGQRENRKKHTVYHVQELSYRKQIARKLRTQYVEGISDNPVTLQSRLRVTEIH